MSLQVYIDDSGGKNQGGLLVMGAVINSFEKWAKFSEAWEKELRSNVPGRISYFKFDEASTLSGEFSHWSSDSRKLKVELLQRHIQETNPVVSFVSLDTDEFREETENIVWDKPGKHLLNSPYVYALLRLFGHLQQTATLMAMSGQTFERVEIFVDENLTYKQTVRDAYGEFAEATFFDSIKMPSEPWFRDDKEFLPLQAADFIAGALRVSRGKDLRSLDWINGDRLHLRLSPFWHHVDRTEIRDLKAVVLDGGK